ADLVKVSLESGRILGRNTPSIELEMHRRIYLERPDVNAIVHTHSPFTIGVSISSNFVHILEEAEIVVGVPATIVNRPSGSKALAESVAREFRKGAHAVIVKNHGVVTVGKDIHHARAVVESLEGWSKILTISKIFGGARSLLRN
ncbi:MAG TPA: class II aldolase/adducin family protein, partial [Nitrososphaera sp.]|nr:class II aldolase/adducin family protein [Nitrososphaera sp.]